MRFNEQDIHQLRDACIHYQQTADSPWRIRQYDQLISKLDDYSQEYECDDCKYCEIHR